MISLFHINTHVIDTSIYSNLLHDKIVEEFENQIASYVGAKYAVSFNSATTAIFLSLLGKNTTVTAPSMIPPVVLNAIITSGNSYKFSDNTEWVGNSYTLHEFSDYKIVDSAQKLEKNQFANECNPEDLLIFSFYPTKPVGSCDGGIIVSNDFDKIMYLKQMALNGMSQASNNWERKINFIGYKMYMNSIQAHIALNNFKTYDKKIAKLKLIRKIYNQELGYTNTSNHLYRIRMPDRDKFIKVAKEHNIICGTHYEPMHSHPVYKINDSVYPKTDEESKHTVSIPFHEELTDSQIYFIISKIKNFQK